MKQKKTADELADMLGQKINLGGLKVGVRPDLNLEWVAWVQNMPVGTDDAEIYALVYQAAAELRALYDLRHTT
jgi:hypothetical protein